MKNLLLIILGLIVTAVAAVLLIALGKPDEFKVERSISIKATADKIYPLIEDFHEWRNWSPWENVDPKMQRSFGGEKKGKGSMYRWDGNANVGAGCMEMKEAIPQSKVEIRLDFIKPFEGTCNVDFSLTPNLEGTNVVWTMTGKYALPAKVMSVFMNVDDCSGKQFELGLKNLKDKVEDVKKEPGQVNLPGAAAQPGTATTQAGATTQSGAAAQPGTATTQAGATTQSGAAAQTGTATPTEVPSQP